MHLCYYCINLTEQELNKSFVVKSLQETPSALYSTCFSQPCFGSEIHALTRKSLLQVEYPGLSQPWVLLAKVALQALLKLSRENWQKVGLGQR